MGRISVWMAAGTLAATLGGCATITRGPNTAWQVNSVPSGAAVKTSNGYTCNATPCVLTMPRKASFTAAVSHEGYKPAEVIVNSQMSSQGTLAMAGNLVVGGVIGVIIDAETGAANDLTPNGQTVTLDPIPGYAAAMGFVDAPYDAAAGPAPGETVAVRRF